MPYAHPNRTPLIVLNHTSNSKITIGTATTVDGQDIVHVKNGSNNELTVGRHNIVGPRDANRKYNDSYVPAVCCNRRCRHIYPSGILVVNSKSTISNQGFAPSCPKCGATGRTIGGKYSQFAGQFTAAVFAEHDLEVIRRLKTVFESAIQTGKYDQALKKAANESPEIAQALRKIPRAKDWTTKDVFFAIVGVLGIAAALHGPIQRNEITEPECSQRVESALYQQCYRHQKSHAPSPRHEQIQDDTGIFRKMPLSTAIEDILNNTYPPLGYEDHTHFQ